jgi:transposase-like protein
LDVFGPDPLAERWRGKVGALIEQLVSDELDAALRARRYQRLDPADLEAPRLGYRHGVRERELTTSYGRTAIRVPRARLFEAGSEDIAEWRSQLIPRYARRARAVDDGILAAYLSGANSRRIRGVLRPLLQDAPLSRSAVSRVVQELKAAFEAWRTAPLGEKRIVYLFLDAIVVKVRAGGQVEPMAVLVALGVHESGAKEVLALELMARESKAAWEALVADLVKRGLRAPVLCTVDGNAGLRAALRAHWPAAAVQRCPVHKLRNLEAHCPTRLLADLRDDFHAIIEATSARAARRAYERFVAVWARRCEGVVRSLEEAGEELLTFFRFPRSQWKSLRSTNAIERLNGEFRRRIKTQASLPSEARVLHLFYGLYASGQIRMRRINGWQDIPQALAVHGPKQSQAA